jgi:hypothetical protein
MRLGTTTSAMLMFEYLIFGLFIGAVAIIEVMYGPLIEMQLTSCHGGRRANGPF